MIFFVTGITGFVGSFLAQKLYSEGHQVHALIRSSAGREADILDVVTPECYDSIKFHYGDLMDYKSLEKIFKNIHLDGCFHLAAQSHPPTGFLDPIGTLNINLIGSANLFDAIEKAYGLKCKICAVSTSEVYGNSGSDGRLLKETDRLAPCNPYASGKAAMDLHFQERMINKKNKGFITRAFSHTGPRRGKTFSISSDAYQIAGFMIQDRVRNENYIGASAKTYQLRVGNLETTRVVISVYDVVEAYYQLMMNDSDGNVYNVCGITPHKMEYFTDYLIKISGLNIEKIVDPDLYRPIDIYYQHGDTSAIRELTGWEPKIPIEETLRHLLNYWIRKLS